MRNILAKIFRLLHYDVKELIILENTFYNEHDFDFAMTNFWTNKGFVFEECIFYLFYLSSLNNRRLKQYVKKILISKKLEKKMK